jgi:hypothetical protein
MSTTLIVLLTFVGTTLLYLFLGLLADACES